MTIYIYSTQYEIGQIIQDHLTSIGNSCFLFKSTDKLAAALKNLKKLPELLILDYLTFNHECFNISQTFYDFHINLPTIFYNCPCLTKSTRARHWLSQIKLLNDTRNIKDFTPYEHTFEGLQNLVESKDLSPYISLMQEPLPLPDKFKKPLLTLEKLEELSNDSEEIIKDFEKSVNLPKNLSYLLEIFQKNENISLTLKDIQKIYKEDRKTITENSLKVLISNLKSNMKSAPNCKFIIPNNRGFYTFIRFKYK